MSEQIVRLFQFHLPAHPDPLMVFARNVSEACTYLFRFHDREARGRGLMMFDTTDSWLELNNHASAATRRVIERGFEGVAVYVFWDDQEEDWMFVDGPDDQPVDGAIAGDTEAGRAQRRRQNQVLARSRKQRF